MCVRSSCTSCIQSRKSSKRTVHYTNYIKCSCLWRSYYYYVSVCARPPLADINRQRHARNNASIRRGRQAREQVLCRVRRAPCGLRSRPHKQTKGTVLVYSTHFDCRPSRRQSREHSVHAHAYGHTVHLVSLLGHSHYMFFFFLKTSLIVNLLK